MLKIPAELLRALSLPIVTVAPFTVKVLSAESKAECIALPVIANVPPVMVASLLKILPVWAFAPKFRTQVLLVILAALLKIFAFKPCAPAV
ncbi:hypothetical protein Sarmat_00441 [Rickettsiales endosymbiont of Paramecium tredecaurelia]|nr:hypothetical protein [Candidatus Sarmatiella mevalonica]